MRLEYNDDELKALVNHKYIGRYKPYRSNARLVRDLDKVIGYLQRAATISDVVALGSLAYEQLKGSPYSSVRVGYNTKYRLTFQEHENRLTLIMIELSEHYGDH